MRTIGLTTDAPPSPLSAMTALPTALPISRRLVAKPTALNAMMATISLRSADSQPPRPSTIG